MKNTITNIILFQISWFVCVLGGARFMPLMGVVIISLAIAYHLSISLKPDHELKVILAATIVGACWESVLVSSNLLVYPSGTLIEGMAPYWIIAMWSIFATTFNTSLRYLKKRLILSSLFGAIGGPLAFLAGERLGGVVFTNHTTGITILAVGWALLVPVLIVISSRWDGFHQDEMKMKTVMLEDR